MPSSESHRSTDRWARRALPVLLLVTIVLAAAGPPAAAAPASPVGGDDTASTTGAATPHGPSGNLTTLVGDTVRYDEFDSVAAVDRAHASGSLETAGDVRTGDVLVVTLESERLGAAYAETNGSDRTDRLVRALNATNASLDVLGPTPPSCEQLRIDLRESRSRTLVNASSGAVRLLLDRGGLAAEGGCDGTVNDGDYEVRADLPTANGTRSESTSFRLDASEPDDNPRIGEIETRRGPPSLADDLRSAADVRRAAAADRLTGAVRVVDGEVAVLTIRSERLASAYANASGETPTERLQRAVNATGGRFALASRPREGVVDEDPDGDGDILLSGPGVRTLPATANDTVHVVVETGAARVGEGDDTVALSATVPSNLVPVLVVPGGSPERYEGRSVLRDPSADLRVRNESANRQRDLAVVGTEDRFVVQGSTVLAPGSRLLLRVRTGNRTLGTRTVRVEAGGRRGDGEFDATFDVGSRSAGDELSVEASRDGTVAGRVPVIVGEPATLRNVTARRVGSAPEGSEVRFAATARYPAPGYVVVRNPFLEDGFKAVPVPAGERVRVNGTVARSDEDPAQRQVRLIAVYDSNRNGEFDGPSVEGRTDRPFPATGGGILAREAELPPPSPTPTVTAPPPGTTVAVTATGAPGFGALAALAGVLLLVVALARRGRSG